MRARQANTEGAGATRTISRRGFLGAALGGIAVIGGGAGWAADRYLVDHVAVADASSAVAATGTAAAPASNGAYTTSGYTSDTASITIAKKVTGSGSDQVTAFIADVTVTDATIVRGAFANDEFGTNIIDYPSNIAADAQAVLAINGDYYGFRSDGIVIRNGVVYRDAGARQGLAFSTDGTVKLYDETATSADQLVAEGVWNTLSFGPGLVEDGRIIDGIDEVEVDTNFGNHSVQGQQPRTGVGMIAPNHFVFVVVDGRSEGYSRGVTMTEFAAMFTDLGAQVAYNLDGGGSSAMIFNGALVNNPLGAGKERGTSDILYVAG